MGRNNTLQECCASTIRALAAGLCGNDAQCTPLKQAISPHDPIILNSPVQSVIKPLIDIDVGVLLAGDQACCWGWQGQAVGWPRRPVWSCTSWGSSKLGQVCGSKL